VQQHPRAVLGLLRVELDDQRAGRDARAQRR